MPWKEAKRAVIECLIEGSIQYELRDHINLKNKLSTGEVSRQQVIDLLRRARGNEHNESPHHVHKTVTVHVVKTRRWYIKWYILDPDAVFISVHD